MSRKDDRPRIKIDYVDNDGNVIEEYSRNDRGGEEIAAGIGKFLSGLIDSFFRK